MAKALKEGMNYYNELVAHMNRSAKAHPESTVVMDAENFRVIATGRDPLKLSKKPSVKNATSVCVVFRRPSENAVWILPQSLTY
jgi:hypothetical protein